MRATRILIVLLGLALAGAIMGAIAGGIVTVTVGVALEGPRALGHTFLYGMGAAFGAACGAILAPVASFAFLRHVPLWRVFVDTAIGTIVAGTATALLHLSIPLVLVAGTAGFFAAAARLAWRTPRKQPAELPPGE